MISKLLCSFWEKPLKMGNGFRKCKGLSKDAENCVRK